MSNGVGFTLSGAAPTLPKNVVERRLHSFHRTTKKGGVVKVVREHLLRSDIACGLDGCSRCAGAIFTSKKVKVRQLVNG